MRQPGVARTDAAIVQAYLSGDRDALGALYDRFGPGLYDTARAMLRDPDAASDVVQDVFCVAAVKLGQLRDPDRVKPWLYAVARHEIYRRSKRRSREGTSLDALVAERGDEPVAPPDPHADGGTAISTELAGVVRDAAAGLDESDQLLLELSARQGLVGADLAAAMGIPTGQAHSMLFRMRERLERAVGAVVVARGGRRRCPDLETVLNGWDGTFDVLWRKRIARHIDACTTCQDTRRGAAVISLAGAAPAFAAPLVLRARTMDAAFAAADAAAAAGGSGASGDSGTGASGDSGTAASGDSGTAASGDGGSGPSGDPGASGAPGSPSAGARSGDSRRLSRSSGRHRRAMRRYRFDDDGFPIGFTRHRSLVGPITATLTAGFAIVLVMSLWSFRSGSVSGSMGEAVAAPPAPTTTPATSATSVSSNPTTSSTSTSSSSTSTTSSSTSTTTSSTSTSAPPLAPTTTISVFVYVAPTQTTRPPRRTTTTEPAPDVTAAPTTTTTSTTSPPEPTNPRRTTTTSTSTPLVFVQPTTPSTPPVIFIPGPFLPIFTTTTFEPPH